jgi:hypothetical protein
MRFSEESGQRAAEQKENDKPCVMNADSDTRYRADAP